MTDHYDVFLSYSHNDLEAATNLRSQLERRGLAVFRDQESIREGDLWLNRLQEAVEACGSFVVLVGRDGVRRWVGAETQVALSRYFGPHDDTLRLPIVPVLLGDTSPETLPAFLRLFQGVPWNGAEPVPESLLGRIRERAIVSNAIAFEGCPFVGLDAFRPDQAQLFFGRQKETLDALACFDTRPGNPDHPRQGAGGPVVRWLEINGNSGCGKSSLMNAGLLPLVDQGWLWPRTGFETWRRIGPMMPGERPLEMLAQVLANAFGAEMADVYERLNANENGLRMWLRSRIQNQTAFLLAIDQFEELFTFADPDERRRFDRLLAAALDDAECPLFKISTVRADFLDRFEDLPRLTEVRNRAGRQWTLPLISTAGLREVIAGPARLAGLDVSEVQAAMVAEAQDEAGGLALVENALQWLWEHREHNRLSEQLFIDQGGLAGILSGNADDLLPGPGPQRDRALELLFRLVKVDPEGRRHTRQRMPLAEAIAVAGGSDEGEGLVYRLAGEQVRQAGKARGSLRLITVTKAEDGTTGPQAEGWVNLIHETLIRSKGLSLEGKPQPYWPTLWRHIEENMGRAARRDLARLLAWLIEDAASKWHAENRLESQRWPEERIQEFLGEAAGSGISLNELVRSDVVHAFLGPILPAEIEKLLALGDEDPVADSDRFGEVWRLPLGHEARATLGERLAALGDRRHGVGLREDGLPDIDWRPIDGGRVTIKGDTEAISRIAEPFLMARYPVTVVQFRAFVSDCFRDGRWRLPGQFPVCRLEHDPPKHRARQGNYPADSVNWYDAAAFCHWLSARLSERFGTKVEVRLPTEFEWELAASGGDPDCTFPWGGDWDPREELWYANTAESGLDRSTAVGLYPLGASKAGILDMAGTVWEWCLNAYDDPDDTGFPIATGFREKGRRAMRGGSWRGLKNVARCVNRRRPDPWGVRNEDIGFRVVCLSPIAKR